MNHKLGINFDEISPNVDISIKFMKEHNLYFGELRTVYNKNFVFWSPTEIKNFKYKIENSGIEIVSVASPLFKWYRNFDDPEIVHDSFGFNPRLDLNQKKDYIKRTIDIANELNVSKIRIFSGLGKTKNAAEIFVGDPLLDFALDYANQAKIDLLLENEPVCIINSPAEIVKVFELNNHNRLKFWFDVANLIELNSDITINFIKSISPRLMYIHLKDYALADGIKQYVPVGEGIIDYSKIIHKILKYSKNELIFTVETHAKINKYEMSSRTIMATRLLLNSEGIKV